MAGLAVLLSGFVVLLWRIGLFDLPESDAGAQAVAAVIALLGGLVVALLTFVGVLLKLSFEREAEERRRIDSSIRGLGLLITPSGQEPSQVQKAGALFALANLGQLRFALSLLQRMWPSGQVDSSHALWVIDRGLEDSDANIQYQAASLLRDNAGRLKREDPTGIFGFLWPDSLRWQKLPDLSDYSRLAICTARLRLLMSNDPGKWPAIELARFIMFLERMMSWGTNPVIKARTVVALQTVLDLPQIKGSGGINRWEGEGHLKYSELHERLDGSMEVAKSEANQEFHELEDWASGGDRTFSL